jgi:prevent-host-death family protein
MFNPMITFTANDAKQQLGHVLDTARTTPVSITKHGRPSFVITSQAEYDALLKLKFEHLKREVQVGFDALDRGEISKLSIAEIAAEALEIHRQNSSSRPVQ